MNFSEALNQIVDITKRPDNRTGLANYLNSAINFCSVEGNFVRDIADGEFAISPSAVTGNILLSVFTRFRKFVYIRPNTGGCLLPAIDPVAYLRTKNNLAIGYYIAGNQVNYRIGSLVNGLLVGYFQYPPTLTEAVGNNEYWMLEVSPYMLIYKAAAMFFTGAGNSTEAERMEKLFAVAFESARRDYRDGVNYG